MDRERDRGRHDLNSVLRALSRPSSVHVASLLVGFGVLLTLGRAQWFVYDDWAILHPALGPADWFVAHQGHWNTAATLLFQALRETVGLRSYLPYLALALLAHLAVVHLLWRVMLRTRVDPWIATGLAGILILFGAAAENVLWAFQVGFMGAVALGLALILVVDRDRLAGGHVVAIVGMSILSLTFSGTALPLVAAAFVLSIIRRGWVPSLGLFVPSGVIYVVWYLLFSAGTATSLAPHRAEILTRVPLFFAAMFGAGYGQFVGVVPLGVLIAIVLAAWVVRRFRRWTGHEAPAYSLLLGSVVFAALTSISRSGGELTAAGAQRYVYVMVALAIPVMALALSTVSVRARAAHLVVIAAVGVVGVLNATLLVVRADEQARVEQSVEREVSAALDILRTDPTIPGELRPIPDVALDLTVADLRAAEADGLISEIPYLPADRAAVLAALGR